MRLLFVFISAALSFLLLSCGDTAKKIDSSKLTLDSLITLYPDSVELLVRKGNELIEKVQYQKALEVAAKAYRLDSVSFETRVLYAEALINKPSRSADDMLRGHLMYKKLVKANPKSEKARGHFGTELMNKASTVIQVSYEKDAKKRGSGFLISMLTTMGLWLGAVYGMVLCH